jgi:hypothetical protein
LPRLLKPIDEYTFVICLAEYNLKPGVFCLFAKSRLNAAQRVRAIDRGLTFANQIEVWAVENEDRLHGYILVQKQKAAPEAAAAFC